MSIAAIMQWIEWGAAPYAKAHHREFAVNVIFAFSRLLAQRRANPRKILYNAHERQDSEEQILNEAVNQIMSILCDGHIRLPLQAKALTLCMSEVEDRASETTPSWVEEPTSYLLLDEIEREDEIDPYLEQE